MKQTTRECGLFNFLDFINRFTLFFHAVFFAGDAFKEKGIGLEILDLLFQDLSVGLKLLGFLLEIGFALAKLDAGPNTIGINKSEPDNYKAAEDEGQK